jgi:hypothetical protein
MFHIYKKKKLTQNHCVFCKRFQQLSISYTNIRSHDGRCPLSEARVFTFTDCHADIYLSCSITVVVVMAGLDLVAFWIKF